MLSPRKLAQRKREFERGAQATRELATEALQAVAQWKEDPTKLSDEQRQTLFLAGNRALFQRSLAAKVRAEGPKLPDVAPSE